jgi:hypothetical protein
VQCYRCYKLLKLLFGEGGVCFFLSLGAGSWNKKQNQEPDERQRIQMCR